MNNQFGTSPPEFTSPLGEQSGEPPRLGDVKNYPSQAEEKVLASEGDDDDDSVDDSKEPAVMETTMRLTDAQHLNRTDGQGSAVEEGGDKATHIDPNEALPTAVFAQEEKKKAEEEDRKVLHDAECLVDAYTDLVIIRTNALPSVAEEQQQRLPAPPAERLAAVDAVVEVLEKYSSAAHGDDLATLEVMANAYAACAYELSLTKTLVPPSDFATVEARHFDLLQRCLTLLKQMMREAGSRRSDVEVSKSIFSRVTPLLNAERGVLALHTERAAVLFHRNQFIIAAHDYAIVERQLVRQLKLIKAGVQLLVNNGHAGQLQVSDVLNSDCIFTPAQLHKKEYMMRRASMTALPWESVYMQVCCNAATALFREGRTVDAEIWMLTATATSPVVIHLPRMRALLELFKLLRACGTPQDVEQTIVRLQGISNRENGALCLSLIQSVVSHYLSSHVVANVVAATETTSGRPQKSLEATLVHAVATSVDAFIDFLTNGEASSASDILNGGIPSELASSSGNKLKVHAIVTAVDFQASYKSSRILDSQIEHAMRMQQQRQHRQDIMQRVSKQSGALKDRLYVGWDFLRTMFGPDQQLTLSPSLRLSAADLELESELCRRIYYPCKIEEVDMTQLPQMLLECDLEPVLEPIDGAELERVEKALVAVLCHVLETVEEYCGRHATRKLHALIDEMECGLVNDESVNEGVVIQPMEDIDVATSSAEHSASESGRSERRRLRQSMRAASQIYSSSSKKRSDLQHLRPEEYATLLVDCTNDLEERLYDESSNTSSSEATTRSVTEDHFQGLRSIVDGYQSKIHGNDVATVAGLAQACAALSMFLRSRREARHDVRHPNDTNASISLASMRQEEWAGEELSLLNRAVSYQKSIMYSKAAAKLPATPVYRGTGEGHSQLWLFGSRGFALATRRQHLIAAHDFAIVERDLLKRRSSLAEHVRAIVAAGAQSSLRAMLTDTPETRLVMRRPSDESGTVPLLQQVLNVVKFNAAHLLWRNRFLVDASAWIQVLSRRGSHISRATTSAPPAVDQDVRQRMTQLREVLQLLRGCQSTSDVLGCVRMLASVAADIRGNEAAVRDGYKGAFLLAQLAVQYFVSMQSVVRIVMTMYAKKDFSYHPSAVEEKTAVVASCEELLRELTDGSITNISQPFPESVAKLPPVLRHAIVVCFEFPSNFKTEDVYIGVTAHERRKFLQQRYREELIQRLSAISAANPTAGVAPAATLGVEYFRQMFGLEQKLELPPSCGADDEARAFSMAYHGRATSIAQGRETDIHVGIHYGAGRSSDPNGHTLAHLLDMAAEAQRDDLIHLDARVLKRVDKALDKVLKIVQTVADDNDVQFGPTKGESVSMEVDDGAAASELRHMPSSAALLEDHFIVGPNSPVATEQELADDALRLSHRAASSLYRGSKHVIFVPLPSTDGAEQGSDQGDHSSAARLLDDDEVEAVGEKLWSVPVYTPFIALDFGRFVSGGFSPMSPGLRGQTLAHLQHPPSVLSDAQRSALHDAIPMQHQLQAWRVIYSTNHHGESFRSMLTNCERVAPVIIVAQCRTIFESGSAAGPYDQKETILGAYINSPVQLGKRGYFGTHECFAFTFAQPPSGESPEESEGTSGPGALHVFRSSHKNEYFIAVKPEGIFIGGGGGAALVLSEDLRSGSTGACPTYSSPPLTRCGVSRTTQIPATSSDALQVDLFVQVVEVIAFGKVS